MVVSKITMDAVSVHNLPVQSCPSIKNVVEVIRVWWFRRGSRGDVWEFFKIYISENNISRFSALSGVFLYAHFRIFRLASLSCYYILLEWKYIYVTSLFFDDNFANSQCNICIVIYFLHLCKTTTSLTYSSTLPSCCESVTCTMYIKSPKQLFFFVSLKYNNT